MSGPEPTRGGGPFRRRPWFPCPERVPRSPVGAAQLPAVYAALPCFAPFTPHSTRGKKVTCLSIASCSGRDSCWRRGARRHSWVLYVRVKLRRVGHVDGEARTKGQGCVPAGTGLRRGPEAVTAGPSSFRVTAVGAVGWGLTSVVARRLPCDGLAGPRRVLSLWVRQLQVAGGHRTLCPERHHEG